MTTSTWQSKQVLKTGLNYNKPLNVINRAKDTTDAEWNEIRAKWKINKLIILDKVPKERKDNKESFKKDRK